MTDRGMDWVVRLGRSWNSRAELKVAGDAAENQGYDKNQRAYVLALKAGQAPARLEVTLAGSEQSPVLNPAFVIRNWGESDLSLKIDGHPVSRGKEFRVGHVPTFDGTDQVIWVKVDIAKPVVITLERR